MLTSLKISPLGSPAEATKDTEILESSIKQLEPTVLKEPTLTVAFDPPFISKELFEGLAGGGSITVDRKVGTVRAIEFATFVEVAPGNTFGGVGPGKRDADGFAADSGKLYFYVGEKGENIAMRGGEPKGFKISGWDNVKLLPGPTNNSIIIEGKVKFISDINREFGMSK